MNNTLGIVFSYAERENLRELTKIRTLCSLPLGGKYRIIDFVLSNFVNSGIYDVSIIARSNFHSLVDHLGSGKEWDLTRKRGGLRILSPLASPSVTDTGIYRGTLEALFKNLHSIKRSMAEYVILSGSRIICSIDYQDLIRRHMESNADITAVYTRAAHGSPFVPADAAIMRMDDQERLCELNFQGEEEYTQGAPWCMETFVLRKSLLEALVGDAVSYGRYDFHRDILQRLAGTLNIRGYEHKHYFFEISTVTNYMQANMNFLDTEIRRKVFAQPVYTKVKDSVPAYYAHGCKVENSIISDGCRIEGTIINSVLSRGVKIGKGAVVKNSMIMQNTEVMRNVFLDHVILDKDVIVRENRQVSGHETYPVVIEKSSIV